MNIYLQDSLLLDKNRFVVVTKSFLDLHCTALSVASAYGGIERNIAHLRTRSCCGKCSPLIAANMPYAMLQKCPICCKNALRCCKNALLLQ